MLQRYTVQNVISTNHSLELQKTCSLTSIKINLSRKHLLNKTKLQELYREIADDKEYSSDSLKNCLIYKS